jgi:hypothetical protein
MGFVIVVGVLVVGYAAILAVVAERQWDRSRDHGGSEPLGDPIRRPQPRVRLVDLTADHSDEESDPTRWGG